MQIRNVELKNQGLLFSPQFSHDLNKLFIDMGKYIQIGFSAGDSPPENVYIRAVPIYAVPEFFTDPVKRCPNHASLSDSSNKDFPTVSYLTHIPNTLGVFT